ncbi:hypothetical protein TrVE_jg5534 [Triparma verrucosa]|uniref:Calcium-transporting ATPase n=1 Tax=Triparma verrucosa TaxID=1606542 RepID=A0A9W7BPB0_9STRA|nr:hypothetical protein TrVE_jg5534 [Triparma verrucosa]
MDESTLASLLTMNAPQALASNQKALKKLGGPDGLLDLLETSLHDGIASASISERTGTFGANFTPSAPPPTFLSLLIDSVVEDATVQILIVSALVSLAVGVYDDPETGWIEGAAIIAAVVIVAFVTAGNDYQKEQQFRKLEDVAVSAKDVKVIRDGETHELSSKEVVVGDVVLLEPGDKIPADGVLMLCDAGGVVADESSLTGEIDGVEKANFDNSKTDPFVLSGCNVTSGSGHMVVVAVGRHSQWGVIKASLEKEQAQTPLQEKLDDMAAMIGYIGMAAAAATFIALMAIRFLALKNNTIDLSSDEGWFAAVLEAFIIAVTIVVVAVPEGLPLAVTISLAFSTKKMLKDNNLIRHLAACETMGNATNICSDKTGTLTENKMKVVDGVFGEVDFADAGTLSADVKTRVVECIANCSTASVESGTNHVIGNKTEGGMLLMLQSAEWKTERDYHQIRDASRFGEVGGGRIFPFSSEKKSMSVLVDVNASAAAANGGKKSTRGKQAAAAGSSFRLYHKGAAERVLENCAFYTTKNGDVKKMTAAKKKAFNKYIHEYALRALRCIALAHRDDCQDDVDVHTIDGETCAEELEHGLTLDAIVGIADPLRPEVPGAIKVCQRAGITVRMVTGDNLETAVAIAKEAGIMTEDGIAMEGAEFRELTPAQLDEILPNLQVLARSSPNDKNILVQRLNGALLPEDEEAWKALHPLANWKKDKDKLLPGYVAEWKAARENGVGEVVGVTGDGTNDGPALKAADVGLSMGISGTDVAKDASDIVILDDNFTSIVKAVLWGRSVYDNIRKFLQFQLTVNVVALTITFVSSVGGYAPPLNAVMMLWVNLIMDTMGALALGTEPPSESLLLRRPYKRNSSLISLPMWRNIFFQSVFQLILLGWLLFEGPEFFTCADGSKHHFTLLFNAFVFAQIFNEFNARDIGDTFDPLNKILKSPMFLGVIVSTIVGQYCIVEFGGDFTSTVPLTQEEWVITAMMGAFSVPLGLFMRLVPISESESSFAGEKKEGQAEAGSKQGLGEKIWNLLVIAFLGLSAYVIYEVQTEERYGWDVVSCQKIVLELVDGWVENYNSIDNPDLDVVATPEL